MPDFLRNLYLVIAQECNLACTYCYAAGGGFGQPERRMSEATMRRGLERLLPLAGERLTLSFFGGEPLLNFPLLRETIGFAGRLAAKSGRTLSYALTTNGTLLDDQMLAVIETHVSHLAVSLDGGAEANADRLFFDGRPAFATVLANLGRLRQARIPFALRATVTPGNVGRIAETVDFLAGLGAASVRLAPAQGIAWSPDERRQLRTEIAEINRRGLRAMLAGAAPQACDHACRLVAQRVAGCTATRPCLAGGGILALAADGSLYPCEHFVGVAALAMGHVDATGFPGERYREIAARFAAATTAARPRCAGCEVRDACGGQCYAEAYAATGSIERPAADYCALVRGSYRAMAPELARCLADGAGAERLCRVIGA